MKWTTLLHNGVAFPPPYDFRKLTVKIQGEQFALSPEQEEMLMAWAKKKDTPYVNDPVFQKNFLGDLIKALPARFSNIALTDIDWRELNAIADHEKTANLSDEEKKKRSAQRKQERDELKAKFGIAYLDGIETEVGAYLVEPPGILMGRGNHPLRGRWKNRIQPEDVILNLGEDAPTPQAPEGHVWKDIVHEHDSMWVASWYDKLSDKRKYVWFADSSHLRQERDQEKYLKAAKLEKNVEQVRAEIAKRMDYTDKQAHAAIEQQRADLEDKKKSLEEIIEHASALGDEEKRKKAVDDISKIDKKLEELGNREARIHAEEMKTRQLAAVCYLIDSLAMRVGDEKDSEEEALTVGASTLGVNNVKITDKIEFDFLGKDSVRWQKSLPLDHDGQILARNLQAFRHGKRTDVPDNPNGDPLFDKIDSTHVNKFLSSIVEGLTAKVFRTYHATHAVRSYLQSNGTLAQDTPSYRKEYVAKLANLEAATVCNHKRTPPKNWEENLVKREVEVEKLRAIKIDVSKLQAQIPAREKTLEKLLASKPDPEKLAAHVQAREDALEKARAAQADLPKLDEVIATRQAALDKAIADEKKTQTTAQASLKKKQDALAALESKKEPKQKKALAEYTKKLRAARKAVADTKKANDEKLKKLKVRVANTRKALDAATKAKRDKTKGASKRIAQAETALKNARKAMASGPQQYEDKIAKAQQALEQAKRAPETAIKNHAERVERASLQLDLAKRTRDYNLGTSMKNYIDPRVFKSWGDFVEFDWKRLYNKSLHRKFAWVDSTHERWKPKDK